MYKEKDDFCETISPERALSLSLYLILSLLEFFDHQLQVFQNIQSYTQNAAMSFLSNIILCSRIASISSSSTLLSRRSIHRFINRDNNSLGTGRNNRSYISYRSASVVVPVVNAKQKTLFYSTSPQCGVDKNFDVEKSANKRAIMSQVTGDQILADALKEQVILFSVYLIL